MLSRANKLNRSNYKHYKNLQPAAIKDFKCEIKPKHRNVIVCFSPQQETLVYSSYLIGKGIILFTLFYTTMNWWHYKKQYDDQENKNKKH